MRRISQSWVQNILSSDNERDRRPNLQEVPSWPHGGGQDKTSKSPFGISHIPGIHSAGMVGASHICKSLLKFALGTTVALYVLNQKHMLPKPIGRIVSKALFWPTLPITLARRVGKWMTNIDDTVVLGGAPFGFLNKPEELRKKYDCTGVINMCEEYLGPVEKYKTLGMRQLWLPTVDHFEPSFEDLREAVEFLQKYEDKQERVYVHCRAGHGRSAAVVFAWLLHKNPSADPFILNQQLCRKRNVRKTLWKQPNLQKFHSWLKHGGIISVTSEKPTVNGRGDSEVSPTTTVSSNSDESSDILGLELTDIDSDKQ